MFDKHVLEEGRLFCGNKVSRYYLREVYIYQVLGLITLTPIPSSTHPLLNPSQKKTYI